ncbi:hypothetical protein M0804_008610 [Polistes exclamans]|nr:hypothetical protein M0804_008610 [Polistes exclamans]
MLKEVGCGSSTPPAGDGALNSNRPVGTAESNSSDSTLGCGGCGREIAERWYLKAADRAWHCGCLRCGHCRMPLAGERTCFARDGNIYCKEDYYSTLLVSSQQQQQQQQQEHIVRGIEMFPVPCWDLSFGAGDESTGPGLPRGLLYLRFLRYTIEQRRSFWAERRLGIL